MTRYLIKLSIHRFKAGSWSSHSAQSLEHALPLNQGLKTFTRAWAFAWVLGCWNVSWHRNLPDVARTEKAVVAPGSKPTTKAGKSEEGGLDISISHESKATRVCTYGLDQGRRIGFVWCFFLLSYYFILPWTLWGLHQVLVDNITIMMH